MTIMYQKTLKYSYEPKKLDFFADNLYKTNHVIFVVVQPRVKYTLICFKNIVHYIFTIVSLCFYTLMLKLDSTRSYSYTLRKVSRLDCRLLCEPATRISKNLDFLLFWKLSANLHSFR